MSYYLVLNPYCHSHFFIHYFMDWKNVITLCSTIFFHKLSSYKLCKLYLVNFLDNWENVVGWATLKQSFSLGNTRVTITVIKEIKRVLGDHLFKSWWLVSNLRQHRQLQTIKKSKWNHNYWTEKWLLGDKRRKVRRRREIGGEERVP